MHYNTTEGRYTVITVVESHRHEGVQYLEQPSWRTSPIPIGYGDNWS